MSRRARPLSPRPHSPRPLATGIALLLAAAVLVLARPDPAAAEVTHLYGFRATVDGFTSWYGSYGMGPLGTAWCIDHGIRSPDPAYRYVPADLSAVPAEVQSAMAWAVATHGQGTDRVTHAGLMLALHDLMGARYPSGRLDVDHLTTARLAGFGGAEGQVLAMARAIKADGVAHASLRGPLQLTVAVGPIDTAGNAPVTTRVADATGQGVAGVTVSFEGSSANLSAPGATTGADGTVALTVRAGGTPTTVQATATVPHLPIDAWAPTTTRAQRVARPIVDVLAASGTVAAATGQIQVLKRGDATAWLPVEGARFRIEPEGGGEPSQTITSGPDGAAPPVTVPIGSYRITEEAPPAGYSSAGPWTVLVEAGRTTTLEASDLARRGQLRVHKVDAVTGASLAGASLVVRYDADADAAFEEVVAEITTTAEPTVIDELLPGRYEITEIAAPAGYEVLAEPVVVDLAAGTLAEAVLSNRAVSPPTTTPPTTTPPTTTPPTTTPPTTTPPTTTPPTTTPPTTPPTTTAQPPITVLAAPPVRPTPPVRPAAPALPRTGVDAVTLGLFGTGLVLVGRSLLELRGVELRGAQPSAAQPSAAQPSAAQPSAAQPSAPRSRSAAMRSSS